MSWPLYWHVVLVAVRLCRGPLSTPLFLSIHLFSVSARPPARVCSAAERQADMFNLYAASGQRPRRQFPLDGNGNAATMSVSCGLAWLVALGVGSARCRQVKMGRNRGGRRHRRAFVHHCAIRPHTCSACSLALPPSAVQLRSCLLIALLFFPREKKKRSGDAVLIVSSSIHQPWLAFGRSQVSGMWSRPSSNQFLVSF